MVENANIGPEIYGNVDVTQSVIEGYNADEGCELYEFERSQGLGFIF